MKLRKFLPVLLILFVSFETFFGQEKPKAYLFDQFPAKGCDEFLARTQNFFYILRNDPNSQGYAVISGKNDELLRKVNYELLIKGVANFMKFDGTRVTAIRSAESENFRIQFWIVPGGAEKPDFNEAAWDFVFPPDTKPFVFDDDSEQICPPVPFETVYSEYLNANPEARGHIVIYEKSLKKYNARKKEALGLLKAISANRLRFFQIKRENSEYGATIEYWLVPRKKK